MNNTEEEKIKKEDVSEIEKLKEQLAECEKLRDEYLAGWQRQKADFLNLQKEIAKKTEEIVKFANEDLIKSQLEDILKKRGLEPIETKNQKFNPELHEAFEEVEGEEEGMIAEEVVRGYKLNGKVIRPAKVKVIKLKT